MESMCDRLRDHRESRGVTQMELARRMGYAHAVTVHYWERDHRLTNEKFAAAVAAIEQIAAEKAAANSTEVL